MTAISINNLDYTALAYALARAGRKIEAEKILDTLKANGRDISPYSLAVFHAGLGDKEKVFFYLNQSFERRVNEMIALRMEAKFDDIRGDARFQEILRKMNLQ